MMRAFIASAPRLGLFVSRGRVPTCTRKWRACATAAAPSPAKIATSSVPASLGLADPDKLRAADPVRVRFAPSPTGSLHVGGARTAIFNYLHARNAGGKFIIRIEDTDEERSTKESELSVLADLEWLGLLGDENPSLGGPCAPYRQTERLPIYKHYAQKLLDAGLAYPCFSTKEEIQAMIEKCEKEKRPKQYDGTWRDADPEVVAQKLTAGEPHTIRFRVPKGRTLIIDDRIRGKIKFDVDAATGDFVILRDGGMPVYNFVASIDDALMAISTVIRAEEHLPNTIAQVLILEALGFKAPEYLHTPLVCNMNGKKLSKRSGDKDTECSEFREMGYLPEVLFNFLATLGWSEGDGCEKEQYTREELIEVFDSKRITASASKFDIAKLQHFNGIAVRAMEFERLAPWCIKLWAESGIVNPDVDVNGQFVKHAIEIVQGSLTLVNDAIKELQDVLSYPLAETLESKEAKELLEDDGFLQVATTVLKAYDEGTLPNGSDADHPAVWKKWVKATGKELGRKGKKLFHPLRLALTGKMSGPDVGEILKVLYLGSTECKTMVVLEARMNLLREEAGKRS